MKTTTTATDRIILTSLIEYKEDSKTVLKAIKISLDTDQLPKIEDIFQSEYDKSTPACQKSKDFSMYRNNDCVLGDGAHSAYKDLTLEEVKSFYSNATIIISEYNL